MKTRIFLFIALTILVAFIGACAKQPIDRRIDDMNAEACIGALLQGIPMEKHNTDLCCAIASKRICEDIRRLELP